MSTLLSSRDTLPRPIAGAIQAVEQAIVLFSRIPHSAIALLARFSVAMTFWMSGQTKIEGLVLDPINATVELGWPRITDSTLELFRSEYALPLTPPELAAPMAAVAEHVFPLLLLVGLASRLSAFWNWAPSLKTLIFFWISAAISGSPSCSFSAMPAQRSRLGRSFSWR